MVPALAAAGVGAGRAGAERCGATTRRTRWNANRSPHPLRFCAPRARNRRRWGWSGRARGCDPTLSASAADPDAPRSTRAALPGSRSGGSRPRAKLHSVRRPPHVRRAFGTGWMRSRRLDADRTAGQRIRCRARVRRFRRSARRVDARERIGGGAAGNRTRGRGSERREGTAGRRTRVRRPACPPAGPAVTAGCRGWPVPAPGAWRWPPAWRACSPASRP